MVERGRVVALAGSRSLPVSGRARVAEVAAGLLESGCSLVVGCCVGADEAVLSACSADSPVSVLAAFGPGGEGAGPASAVGSVLAFARAGGAVSWWAGGGPAVPLRVRLAARTQAVVRAGSGGLVAFFGSAASRGTLLACRVAAGRGAPVVAFPLGSPGEGLPALGPGAWVPLHGVGLWAGAWYWLPAQSELL